MPDLRSLPSVEHILQTKLGTEFIASYGRTLTLLAVRETLGEIRAAVTDATVKAIPDQKTILEQVQD